MATDLPDATQRRAATIAGLAYFVIIVTSILSIALGPSELTMGGVAPESLEEIASHQLMYRVGAVYELLMYAGVVLLSLMGLLAGFLIGRAERALLRWRGD